jgi:hypothetical protein
MRRAIIGILLLAIIADAALDQHYVQTVARGGGSSISVTSEVALFEGMLSEGGLERMARACEKGMDFECVVDAGNRTVTLSEDYAPGGYYTYSSEYGIPFITHTLTVGRIGTDRFSRAMDDLLDEANATNGSSGAGGTSKAIDLSDKARNAESARVMRLVGANVTYAVIMPSQVSEARAGGATGAMSGNRAEFDLAAVLAESKPMVVKSQEINFGFLIAIAGVAALIALAVSFARTKPGKRKK